MATGVWFARPRTVELRSEPDANIGGGDVRVRTLVSAISHGTEMLVFRGEVPRELELDLPTLSGSFAFPVKFGYANVGRVIETGSDVSDIHAGDIVFVHHPHQDEYRVAASSVVTLPASLDPERGVFFANAETAVNIVLDAHPRVGEVVAVFGQGVVGLLTTQLLGRAGARVIAIEPVELRRHLALACGAEIAVAPDDAASAVAAATSGRGADVAIEASGNAGALQHAIDAVAFQGTVVVASWYGTKPASLMLGGRFHRSRLRMKSSQVGVVDPELAPRWDRARRTELTRSLLADLVLRPLITHRVPFARAAEAYALIDERPDDAVQVLLTYP